MNESEKKLVRNFFQCTKAMFNAKIVRSDKILGDLGEWICVKKYGLKLEESGRHPGYDGLIGNKKVQVKVHNSPKGTNLSVGNPEKYDELIILIGPNSRLKSDDQGDSFRAYRFNAKDVGKLMRRKSGHYCAKGQLTNKAFDSINI